MSQKSYFQVPFRGNNSPNPIFFAGLMLGAKDSANKVCASSAWFIQPDFWASPLNASTGQTTSQNCRAWDKIWMVTGSEIRQHRRDWQDNNRIDNPIPSILGFPARRNPYFLQQNGFELPDTPAGYAAFFDLNGDGIYDPMAGDFPMIERSNPDIIPAQITWCVFNDNGNGRSVALGGQPLKMEVQLTTWALECTDTSHFLNNTVFASYKILSRNPSRLDSLAVGLWADFDLDCQDNDMFGCDTLNHCFYAYNGRRTGDTVNCRTPSTMLHGSNPPAVAITFLNHPLSNSGVNIQGTLCHPFSGVLKPRSAVGFFNNLHGKWQDGTPFRYGNMGLGTNGKIAKHLYPSDPTDTTGWSMAQLRPNPVCNEEMLSWGSTVLGAFRSHQIQRLDIAFSVHRGRNLDAWQNVTLLRNTEIPELRRAYTGLFERICTPLSVANISDKNELLVQPNPAQNILQVETTNGKPLTIIELYGISGKLMVSKNKLNTHQTMLEVGHLPRGFYILRVNTEGGVFVKKIILQ
jgi:Secretion system C-terminal sorting domain